MLLGTLGANLSGNMLPDKWINRAGEGITRTGYVFQFLKKLIPPHLLTNSEMQKYHQNEPRFNGVYSRDNLSDKIKDRAYVINLDEYSDIGTHWIALYGFNNNVTYFDSFGIEHIPKEISKIIRNKNIR